MKYLLQKHFQNLVKKTQILHLQKLYDLWGQQRARSPNSIVNLSNKQLSIPEEEVLRFGLNHHILPRKIDQDTVKISLERLLYSIKNKLYIRGDSHRGAAEQQHPQTFQKLKKNHPKNFEKKFFCQKNVGFRVM